MEAYFYVQKDLYEETKKLIRENNLYFISNPVELIDSYGMLIGGNILYYNNFLDRLWALERLTNQVDTPKSKVELLKRLVW